MQLRITKIEDKILLKNGNEEIETYSLTDSIDFSRFMSLLLKNDFKEHLSFEEISFEPTSQEDSLIKMLIFIKDSYNKKVDEYSLFLSENSKEIIKKE